jgi:hypothetical protein
MKYFSPQKFHENNHHYDDGNDASNDHVANKGGFLKHRQLQDLRSEHGRKSRGGTNPPEFAVEGR